MSEQIPPETFPAQETPETTTDITSEPDTVAADTAPAQLDSQPSPETVENNDSTLTGGND